MKTFNYLLLLSALFFAVNSKGQSSTETKPAIASVKIGTQEWTAENLNVSAFRNGDPITEVKNQKEWKDACYSKKPAWCYYKNDPKNGAKYGKLYNWWAVSDPRGLAPEGWHVATNNEWNILVEYLGGFTTAGDAIKSCAAGTSTGLAAPMGGTREVFEEFYKGGERAYYWTSNEKNSSDAILRMLSASNSFVYTYEYSKGYGMSVRCVKD
ncbi:MAG TPA: fibrobacter succinogenes major paralogous domain-containing protein [Bacteroidales bacterium]|nr:fibrobacter succinogenes major paralogous domain-containing protein [Bacteroidales bacterium]